MKPALSSVREERQLIRKEKLVIRLCSVRVETVTVKTSVLSLRKMENHAVSIMNVRTSTVESNRPNVMEKLLPSNLPLIRLVSPLVI